LREREPVQRPDANPGPARQGPVVGEETGVVADIRGRANRVAAAYRDATGRSLHLTSGRRTAHSQADAMYIRFVGGERGGYLNAEALGEILAAFDGHQGEAREAVVAAMERVIQAQMGRGEFISNHLSGRALDFRLEPTMTEAERAALREAVQQEGGTVLFETTPPHIHIQF
jgi:hypothetical protein